MNMDRREFLKGAGALVVSFTIPELGSAQQADPKLQQLDAWLAVGADGQVTVFCGKVELGTGVQTALAQIVAEELDVAFARVFMLMGDTALCPNQGPTVGSQTVYRAGPQLRQAAAEARKTLLEMAAAGFKVEAAQLKVVDGIVSAPEGGNVSYAELVGGKKIDRAFSGSARPKSPDQHTVVGKPIPRVELPAKVFGTHVYIQNLRMPGMLHGRVVRPPMPEARLDGVDEASVKSLPGDVRVVVKGNFVGVVADREEQAIRAARALKVRWTQAVELPKMEDMPAFTRGTPGRPRVLATSGDVEAALSGTAKSLRAQYYVPHQMHGSIGASCAVASVTPEGATLWSPTQSSFNLRDAVALVLGMPRDKVRLVWIEGSGCYGHNGADDVTADAALMSQAVGRPVRVQWMRHDEHGNEPKGAAMVMEVAGALDPRGNVAAWDYQVWSPGHAGRPAANGPGNTLAGAQLGLPDNLAPAGADRNARPTYVFPNSRVRLHLLQSTVLRVSSLRGLGSPQNTFANESFIDELAHAAGADPIEYRIRHLKDERAIAVLESVAKLAQWSPRPAPRGGRDAGPAHGRGVAFVHYDNYSGYVAIALQVRVERATGKVSVERVAAAHDCGLIVNPDGLRNQIEGNIVQTLSRALLEEVKFDTEKVTSIDWQRYPILRFSDVPEDIAITLINRPDKPSVGAGEPAAAPVMAAVANAIFDATGVRLRSVPFSAERVKAALA
ncbi:MAG TPA: molybdopterin cofactor-binding domain-containing protein [Burkholderiales bacterium]|nr:molybdopterin cofactor-binding domain-containing protein [Burkholderiales bacterium]